MVSVESIREHRLELADDHVPMAALSEEHEHGS